MSQTAPIETIEQHAKLIILAKRLEDHLLSDFERGTPGPPAAAATAAGQAPTARIAVPA